ncbi:GGDEF domain-containing protein [Alteromonas lipolytica]|uniref:diguanylate cyclase n=1 Tax=Alteromonas lipolytica TaxID=1856405 RepID=A0A1E8FF09_9ALTE|nr:diguanylate cyclase [Alteromonas lipolytica]OFI34501.1 diguanylate cyclase [Alteromonas lipolytica]
MEELSRQHWLHDLLSSLEVGIVVLDRHFKVEVWNQFMENHSNLRPSQIIGQSLLDHFPEIDADWLALKAQPVFNLKTPVFLIWEQRPYLFKFGCNRPVTSELDFMYQNVTLFPLSSLTGNIERLCMLVYDVTDQASSQLNIEKLNNQLTAMSRIDGLTQLFNRRYWQERFQSLYRLAKRRDSSNTAMMLDIDHFKSVNDTYGHQAGDKVIQALAQIIKQQVRETDLAGRYGGEEFAVILSDAPAEGALKVAERIRKVAEATEVTHEGQTIRFTVSLGLAEFSGRYQNEMQWLDIADQALYEAKQNGRNQAVLREL